MYVCLCKGVTDSQIKQAMCEGACSMRCLNRELGVATQCGKCAIEAKRILRSNQAIPVNTALTAPTHSLASSGA